MNLCIVPLNLAHRPTPITAIEDLVPGTRIHVKRDDLTGLLYTGNKIRKLEFLLAKARDEKADMVITCGPVQSNHVRATVAACAELRLKVLAFLRGQPEEIPDGNFLLDSLLGAEFRFITADQYYNHADEIMAAAAAEFRGKGLRPYVVPEGGSNGIGALGYALAFDEMAAYVAENKVDAIFCAVGSGGTIAGLVAGKQMHGMAVPIVGNLVCDNVPVFQKKITAILGEMGVVLGRTFAATPDAFRLDDRFIGQGYARLYPEVQDVIRQVARFGLILDPIYTAKAFHGMLTQLGEFGCRNPLFVHTGGLFGLFPRRSELLPEG